MPTRVVRRAFARSLRTAGVLWLLLVATPSTLLGQSLPDVPPLPSEERLLERTDLTATLRVSAAEIVAGERPDLSLVLTNRSQRRLRVVDARVNSTTSVRAFDASGNEMLPRVRAIIERLVLPTSVTTLPVLGPGESRAFSVGRGLNMPGRLPVGEYVFRVTYVNRAGWPRLYDVYEPGAEDVWEGDLTASVTVRVRPLDPASEQRLIQQVREGNSAAATAAIHTLGLSRAVSAVDPITERLERDDSVWPAVLEAFGYIATPDAARALAAAYARTPMDGPLRLFIRAISIRDIPPLVRGAGCDALVLSAFIAPSQATASDLRGSCPEASDLLRAEVASRQPGRTLTLTEAVRQEWATAMLKALELPEPPPAPTEYPEDRLPPPPVAERLPEYVAAIVGFPGGHSEAVAIELSGIARFGTHDTFRELRTALSAAGDETGYVIGEALRALTFEDEWRPLVDRAEEIRRWDRWWQQHGGATRETWARDALARQPELSTSVNEINGAARAAEYLLALDRPQYEQALVTHRSWRVRVRAALFLAASDAPYAAALLLRELENRFASACENAGSQLAGLTGSWFPFKCSSAQERQAAAAHWTRLALARR